MNRTLFDQRGVAVAYIAPDYHETIYLWSGLPVAYLHEAKHVYGVNGRHLAWLIDGVIFDHNGERVGFFHGTCPVPPGKEPAKGKRCSIAEIRPRWNAPPLAALTFNLGREDLAQFLRQGEVSLLNEEASSSPLPDS